MHKSRVLLDSINQAGLCGGVLKEAPPQQVAAEACTVEEYLFLGKNQLVVVAPVNGVVIAFNEVSLQDFQCQRIFDKTLDSSF